MGDFTPLLLLFFLVVCTLGTCEDIPACSSTYTYSITEGLSVSPDPSTNLPPIHGRVCLQRQANSSTVLVTSTGSGMDSMLVRGLNAARQWQEWPCLSSCCDAMERATRHVREKCMR